MTLRESRQALLDVAGRLNQSGLNQGTSGNLSVREEDGFCVTPSGVPYEEMQLGDLVQVNWDGSWRCETDKNRPTSEWRIHRDILRSRSDISAVVHVHPPFSTALACLGRDIPPFHYMVAVAGGFLIKCAPYATFGTQELSDNVLTALADRRACLMANHGMIACDTTPARALALAIEVEALAAQYVRCLQLGEPDLLSEEEMRTVLEKFAEYHGNKSSDGS